MPDLADSDVDVEEWSDRLSEVSHLFSTMTLNCKSGKNRTATVLVACLAAYHFDQDYTLDELMDHCQKTDRSE